MKTTVQLESKDIRAIIAQYLGISIDQVIPNRYSFSVAGIEEHDIKKKLENCTDSVSHHDET